MSNAAKRIVGGSPKEATKHAPVLHCPREPVPLDCSLCVALHRRDKQTTEAAAGPQVVLDWNATAVATTIAAGKSQPESGLYVGLTQAAVYDAVIAIDGGYHPYLIVPGVPPGSSDQAAAAAAAYGVLVGYFPTQKPALDAAYATSLAGIPDGTAKTEASWSDSRSPPG